MLFITEHIENIMEMEESVQHAVMNAIQEVKLIIFARVSSQIFKRLIFATYVAYEQGNVDQRRRLTERAEPTSQEGQ